MIRIRKKRRVFSGQEEQIIHKFINHYNAIAAQSTYAHQLIKQLINDGILDIKKLRNYLIIQSYYEQLSQSNCTSLTIVNKLGDEFQMTPRQIQNIIYKSLRDRTSIIH
jgi:hypothetical protein